MRPRPADHTLPSGTAAGAPEAATVRLQTLDPGVDPEGTVPVADAPDEVDPGQPGYLVARRYRLLSAIGRGAHGKVWEAEDTLTGERVALKMLSPDMGGEAARIRREVASMRLLRLSGVVRLLDEGTDGDRPFLVMDRVHGAPFPGVAAPAPWAAIAPAATALLSTLARMHALGIVHRDLKPANVLVDAEGRPTILDFGLARPDTTLDEGITDHGSILGTPAYLAPEQVRGDPVSARSDLYALGVMLYEALSGRFPHALDNLMRMLRARITEPPTPLLRVAPGVPADVAALVDALLAMDPAARPRSAGEVLDRLRGREGMERAERAPRGEGPEGTRGTILDAVRCGAGGAALSSAEALAPLAEEDLRDLFTGADRLFHLREDAARVLHRRTQGVAARIADDLAGWAQAGLARWDGERIAVDRDVIERLEAGLIIMPLPPPRAFAGELPGALDDLLHWILLAHPHAYPALLAAAQRVPAARIDADLAALGALGAVRVLPDGRVVPLAAPSTDEGWPLERRREVHRRIALSAPPGTPRRLYHLVVGADEDAELGVEIAAEALHLGRRLAVEGRLELAAAAMSEGLRAGRRLGMSGSAPSLALLSLAVEIALEDGTPRALDRALYELYRVKPRAPAVDRLAQLVRAALGIGQRTERALSDASDLPPFANLDLERRRQDLRAMAVRVRPPAEQEALIDELHAWAEASPDPLARGAYAGWLGRLRYRQGLFAEAAALHAEAARSERWATAKLAALLRSATCTMEAFDLPGALASAREARERARGHRLPAHEASAERVIRSVVYRTGMATSPDLDLCDAAASLRVGDTEAMLCLNEAAIAFRAGDRALAHDLARRAQAAWTAMGEVSGGALLAASLAMAAQVAEGATGAAATADDDVDALVGRALVCPLPGVGIQALGLLAMAGHALSLDAAAVDALAGQVAASFRDQRLEVLSVREALAALTSRPRPSPGGT